jgi:hypothetical protein
MAVLQTDSKCSNTYVYARIHDYDLYDGETSPEKIT